jgi:hypothetical protein
VPAFVSAFGCEQWASEDSRAADAEVLELDTAGLSLPERARAALSLSTSSCVAARWKTSITMRKISREFTPVPMADVGVVCCSGGRFSLDVDGFIVSTT